MAVANLANHRREILNNPDLKNRDYCARGIPFVSSTLDDDFPTDFPFILSAEPKESPIDIDKIIQFYSELRDTHPKYSEEMRSFAGRKLSWEAKFKPLVERILAH